MINWLSEPVLAVTSLAALTYAVFNAMSALLQLIKDPTYEGTEFISANSEIAKESLKFSSFIVRVYTNHALDSLFG